MNQSLKKLIAFRPITQLLGFGLTILGLIGGSDLTAAIFFGLSILMGPIFCGWICPFGAMQDLFRKIGAALGIKKLRMPRPLHLALTPLRYIFLGASILVGLDFVFTILSLDPRVNLSSLLNGHAIAIGGFITIGSFLLISLFFERPFCQYGCIEGAKHGLFSTLRPVAILRNSNSCIDCGQCNKSCPMQIDIMNNPSVRSLQCTSCMSCVASCPVENTLTLGLDLPDAFITNKKQLVIGLLALSLLGLVGYNNYKLEHASSGDALAASTATEEALATLDSELTGIAAGVAEGIYEGTGTGFRGDITIAVTVLNQQVTHLEVIDSNEDAQWFTRAWSSIVSDIIGQQEADVDNVSGATYSSNGIKEAVANAMMDAGSLTATEVETVTPSGGHGNTDNAFGGNDLFSTDTTTTAQASDIEIEEDLIGAAAGIADGVYEGTGTGFKGTTTVSVTVKNQQITDISVISTGDDDRWFQAAYNSLLGLILGEQTPDVDSVSGATYSSMGLKSAVADALINAGSTTVTAIENNLPNAGNGSHGHGGGRGH